MDVGFKNRKLLRSLHSADEIEPLYLHEEILWEYLHIEMFLKYV